MISQVFETHRSKKKKVFIPYITAGDPDLQATEKFILALQEGGASILEIGVPFSEPVADGPVIQRAMERALSKNYTLNDILEFLGGLKNKGLLKIPVVIFSYLNPIFKMGFEEFSEKAMQSGIDGLLVVDLPPEEKDELNRFLDPKIEKIFLASPTTTPLRMKLINDSSTGFVYYVSRLGVTGTQRELSATLKSELKNVRESISKPLVVGFGLSSSDQIKSLVQASPEIDGVVVGSALVEIIEKTKDFTRAADQLRHFTKSIVEVL